MRAGGRQRRQLEADAVGATAGGKRTHQPMTISLDCVLKHTGVR
jgi:hypothetical protein